MMEGVFLDLCDSLADFERDEVAVGEAAGFVVDGDLEVGPFAGEVVGADEKKRFVVRGAEFEDDAFGGDGENGGGGGGAVHGDQAASEKFGGTRVLLGAGLRGFFSGGALGGVFFEHIKG